MEQIHIKMNIQKVTHFWGFKFLLKLLC